MVFIIVLLIVGLAALIGLVGVFTTEGYDDGLYYNYDNGHQGLPAWAYDMGYESAAGRDDRKDANLKRNEARRAKMEAKING